MTDTGRKVFLFSCDYDFLPLGVIAVKGRLDEALKKADLLADDSYSHETSTWTIDCFDGNSDEIYAIFHEIVLEIVMKEFETYDSDDDGNTDTAKQSAYMANKLVCLPAKLQRPSYGIAAVDGIESGLKKVSLNGTEQTWSYDSPDRAMHQIIPLFFQEQIAELTSSQLIQDINLQKIYIRSQSEADCNRALHKLDTLLKRDRQLRNGTIQHVFYSEDKSMYQISVRSLLHVKPELAQKTLINKEDLPPGYGKIQKASVLRYCALDQYRSIYTLVHGRTMVPVLSQDKKDKGSVIWINYIYPKKGDEWTNPLNDLEADEIRDIMRESEREREVPKSDQIRKWMADLPDDSTQTMVQPLGTYARRDTAPSPPSQTLTQGVVGGFSFMENLQNRRERGPADQLSKQELGERRTTSDLTEIWSSGPVSKIPKVKEVTGSRSNVNDLRDPRGFSTSLLDADNYDTALAGTKTLTPVKREVSLTKEGMPKVAALQPQAEVDSRKYYSTMKQGKPRGGANTRQHLWRQSGKNLDRNPKVKPVVTPPSPIPPDPTRQFMKDMEAACRTMLGNMRTWKGEVRLEAQLGRILIRNGTARFTPGSEKPTSWDREKVQELLTSGVDYRHTSVQITKVITSALAEEQYLLEMKDSSGIPLWQTKKTDPGQPMWAVNYEFKCQIKTTGATFVVQVDAETFAARVKTTPGELFGAVNVHCLARNWDYRVVGVIEMDLSDTYGYIADIVVGTLFIPENLERPTLMFEIHEDNDVDFRAIRAIRSCRYLSTDGKSVLNLNEVYDMNINYVEKSNTGHLVYHAWVPATKTQPGEEPAWLEVSISSRKAETYLEENKELELGEETRWREDDMIEGEVLPAIYLPACHLVKNMDGVGAYNDNDWRPQPKENTAMTMMTSTTQTLKPTKWENMGYW